MIFTFLRIVNDNPSSAISTEVLTKLFYLWNKLKLFPLFEENQIISWNYNWAGMTCKKTPCYMRRSACRWLVAENAKISQSYVKHFWIFLNEKYLESWLLFLFFGFLDFMNHLIMFLDRDNKTKLISSYFLKLLWEKIDFSLKSVIGITVYLLCSRKKVVEKSY